MSNVLERAKARAEAAVERTGADFNETEVGGGGGNYKLPAEGKQKARLVGYTEIGKHSLFQGNEPQPHFFLTFACYGKDSLNEDGTPTLVDSRDIKISRNEKANAIKLFKSMCPKGDAKNFLGMLDRVFWITVSHREGKAGADGKPRVYANVAGLPVPAVKEIMDDDDNITGYRPVTCPEAPANLFRIYEWDVPSKEDFDNLSPRGKIMIRKAVNFQGSAIQQLVGDGEGEGSSNNGAATQAPPEDSLPEVPDAPVESDTEADVDEDDLPTI